ncbi:MAG: hypothetical protein V1821_04045 [bacterium]
MDAKRQFREEDLPRDARRYYGSTHRDVKINGLGRCVLVDLDSRVGDTGIWKTYIMSTGQYDMIPYPIPPGFDGEPVGQLEHSWPSPSEETQPVMAEEAPTRREQIRQEIKAVGPIMLNNERLVMDDRISEAIKNEWPDLAYEIARKDRELLRRHGPRIFDGLVARSNYEDAKMLLMESGWMLELKADHYESYFQVAREFACRGDFVAVGLMQLRGGLGHEAQDHFREGIRLGELLQSSLLGAREKGSAINVVINLPERPPPESWILRAWKSLKTVWRGREIIAK